MFLLLLSFLRNNVFFYLMHSTFFASFIFSYISFFLAFLLIIINWVTVFLSCHRWTVLFWAVGRKKRYGIIAILLLWTWRDVPWWLNGVGDYGHNSKSGDDLENHLTLSCFLIGKRKKKRMEILNWNKINIYAWKTDDLNQFQL